MYQVMQSLLVLVIRGGPHLTQLTWGEQADEEEMPNNKVRQTGCCRSWWQNLGSQHPSPELYPLGCRELVLKLDGQQELGNDPVSPAAPGSASVPSLPGELLNSHFGKQRKRSGLLGLGLLWTHAETRIPKMSILSGYSPETSPTCASRAKALLQDTLLGPQPQPVLSSTLWPPINT